MAHPVDPVNERPLPAADRGVAPPAFDWRGAAAELAGGADPSVVNIADLALDRHVAAGRGAAAAIRALSANGAAREMTYAELAKAAAKFAGMLAGLGIRPGDTVATLLPPSAELVIAALGTLKAGGVFCPLHPGFGPEPLRARLALGAARVLVTGAAAYERKIAPIRHLLPALAAVLLADEGAPAGTVPLAPALAAATPAATAATTGDTPALLHFTSGTTGVPKGALHGHRVVVGHHVTARLVMGLAPGDVYWCTAAPGWITGTAYGLIAPLVAGATAILDQGGFDAVRWYGILRDHKVAVWFTTPTAVRMLMGYGAALARSYRPRELRLALSTGEPLNPEAVIWGRDSLGVPFHDTWWQTETGCIAIANLPGQAVKPGSMGRPLPGVEVALVRRLGGDAVEVVEGEATGEIAVRRDLPTLFQGYVGDPGRFRACFAGDWYLTGDLARRDADGHYWFIGRSDDVIKSAGHLIGPFEVEGVLMDHPAVAEAGVIGRPDPVFHQTVAAYVTLNPGFLAGEALRDELLQYARERLGKALAPRVVVFTDNLPKTTTGKILRRALRDRDLGISAEDALDQRG